MGKASIVFPSGRHVCIAWELRIMEAWREDLQGAIISALGFEDENDEFEDELFLQMVANLL